MGFVVLERHGMTVIMEKIAQQDGTTELLTRTNDL
jgi:hypothetical protein